MSKVQEQAKALLPWAQEQAKALLPWAQALADGKTVEWQASSSDWIPVFQVADLFALKHGQYCFETLDKLRIKPEPKWRPFTKEEVIKQLGRVVRMKDGSWVELITSIDTDGDVFMLPDGEAHDPIDMLKRWEFYDPTTGATSPFGALETE